MALLAVRYYTPMRYPFLAPFESYYVQTLQLSECLQETRITWAMPKEPRVFTIPVSKYKQLNFLDHKLTTELRDHLPFEVLEAGFDDNTPKLLYRTIYLQVNSI